MISFHCAYIYVTVSVQDGILTQKIIFVYHIPSCPFGSFLSLCVWFMFCILLFNSVNCVFVLLRLCTLIIMQALFCTLCVHRANWHSLATLRGFLAFSSVVRQMPRSNSQRRGPAHTLPSQLTVLFYVLFVSIVLFSVLFVCKCVLYYCHRVSTQLQLKNISHISYICDIYDICDIYPYAGFSLHKDTTPPQPNHTVTPTHIEPEQYNP